MWLGQYAEVRRRDYLVSRLRDHWDSVGYGNFLYFMCYSVTAARSGTSSGDLVIGHGYLFQDYDQPAVQIEGLHFGLF